LLESLVYDNKGQLLASTLPHYLIPAAADSPNTQAISLKHRPSWTEPARIDRVSGRLVQ
jgi:CO/xanthine dehydrogenase Mo-binding subunit